MTSSTRSSRWWLLFGVWLIYFVFGLAATSLAPLVQHVRDDLLISAAGMGLILGIWQFVFIGSAIPCGMLLDRLGPGRALLIGGACVVASLLLRGLADSFLTMLLAVMVFGLGGPIVSTGAPKVIAGLFTGSDRGLAMGIYMTGPSIGGIVSLTMTHSVLLPALGGDWRNIMFLWAGIALGATLVWLALAGRLTADPLPSAAKAPSQFEVLKTLGREQAVVIVLLMSVGVFLFNHGLNNWLPELLRASGMTFSAAGYWAAIPTVVGIIGSLFIPRLATPERRFHILIGLCIAAALASFLLQFDDPATRLFALFLQGVARSSLMTILILTLVELPAIGERYAGVASGVFFSAAEIGGMLGPLSIGLLLDATGGFGASLWLLTAVAMLTGVGAARLQRLAGKA